MTQNGRRTDRFRAAFDRQKSTSPLNVAPECVAGEAGRSRPTQGFGRLQLLTRALILAIGALALEQLLVPSPARAQSCNKNPSPPAAPPANYTENGGTFQNAPNFLAFSQGSVALSGCPAPATSADTPGSPGQAGGEVTSNSQSVRIVGNNRTESTTTGLGAAISANGGFGGTGGVGSDQGVGGAGGAGGAGGSIVATFDGTIVPDQSTGTADIGLLVNASGGVGGTGGVNTPFSIYEKLSGPGGAGGNGGTVSLAASGSIQAFTGISVGSEGAGGGTGGEAVAGGGAAQITSGDGGNGGNGNKASFRWLGGSLSLSGTQGVLVSADGGEGGSGGESPNNFSTTSGNGGNGGNGGTASTSFEVGSAKQTNSGSSGANVLVTTANGGDGGNGGPLDESGTVEAGGGSGGAGGTGGTASATLLASVNLTGATGTGVYGGAAILVQSNGGIGGAGIRTRSFEGGPGGGGAGGAGGSASLTLGNAASVGTIGTSGDIVHGALVQSVGGAGGNGGNADWGSQGGAGGNGGNGGPVSFLAPNASVIVQGQGSIAAIAQSVGGGGGTGGDAVNYGAGGAVIAIGGNGGAGGDGGAVNLTLGTSVFGSTGTVGGGGILAQSIGGAGGVAGSASIKGGMTLLTMAIGGDAKGGGAAGPVNVNSSSLIGTRGDHAAGLTAQSIGGGGGKGGSAFTFDVSAVPTSAVSIGGKGGDGGAGGNVSVTNAGQISTLGADAQGVLIQSIGGGGGVGGAAAARAIDLSPSKYVPAIAVTVAMGGAGGTGNTAGTASLANSGLITTAGDGATAVMAQSIGGGGGAGGDSTAASYAGGNNSGGVSISVSVAIGGTGGTGGNGNAVTLNNTGLIATLGQDAYGVFAQSVGGGGGTGGAGDASASSNSAEGSVSAGVAVGGSSGSGGDGGTVTLTNGGAVTTVGDGSDGLFAQSVGGGGGAAGGGVTTGAGDTLSSQVGVGGKGGAGGAGGAISATNSGSIVTRGTDSVGLLVQSIGGGGGKGGKGGATAGGTSALTNAGNLISVLNGGVGGLGIPKDIADGVIQIGEIGENFQASLKELQDLFSQPQAGESENGSSPNIDVSVSVGGNGGAGGAGGAVTATNHGAIVTYGAQSDGIYAQSVGGGGGSAGAATSTSAASDDAPAQTAISVGGNGAGGGNGGNVTVVNGAGGSILTQGVTAVGIFAQSVGGGGGEAASAGAVSGSFKSISVALGGSGGAAGAGGDVSVTTGDGDSTITTTGKHGIGILAQSVGGGGGVARTMTTDMTFDPSKLFENPQGRAGDVHGLGLTFGAKSGAGGVGGTVTVTTSGAITTSGRDAHAILAQSIGGGGGLALGGQAFIADLESSEPLGDLGGSGSGGSVTVNLKPNTVIQTSGNGAYGVLAQSIGGGGGVLGDLSRDDNSCINACFGLLPYLIAANRGDGGAVTVTAERAAITTTGKWATGIFAQSVGGGGGIGGIATVSQFGPENTVNTGSVGGAGAGGSVNVSLVGSHVLVSGAFSTGILAESDGSTQGSSTISIDANSSVTATGTGDTNDNPFGAAIGISSGTSNRIINAGLIKALDINGNAGIAIQTNTPQGRTTLDNTGTIQGNIDYNDPFGSLVDNRVGGVIDAPNALMLGGGGLLQNAGTLHVGGAGRIGRTVLTGDLVQSGTGVLRIDTNAYTGKADLLEIRGKAEIGGTIRVDPVGLRKGETDPIVTATGGLTVRSGVEGVALPVFSQTAVLRGNTLSIATDAAFGADDPSKSRNQRGLTGALQSIWDNGLPGFEQGFAGLARLPDERAYRQALDSLSGEVHASAITAQAQTAFFVQEAILDRLRFGDGEAAGVPRLGLTGSIGTRFAPGTTLPAAYSADLPGGPAVTEVPVRPAASGYAVWGQAFGAFGETASNGNAGRLSRQIGGFVLGIETGAGALADWRAGLAAGYGVTTFDVPARQSTGSVESGFGAAYARGSYGPLQVRLGAAYTGSALDTRRTVSVPGISGTASGRAGGDTVQGFGELGYRFGFAQGYLEPFVGAAAMRIRRDGFAETGGAAALTVAGRSYELATVTAGLQGQAALAPLLGIDLPLVARGLLGYRRAFGDVEPRALLAFSGGGQSFLTAGVPIARDALVASVGLDLALASGVTVGVNYTGQVGDRAQDHAVKGLLSYRW